MDTPLRRSRRLEGLKPESPENPTSVLRVRRVLVEFESNPKETGEPRSPPGLGSPSRQPETSPGSPSLPNGPALGSPRKQPELDSGSPEGHRDPGLNFPQNQPESSPESHLLQPKPSEESPKFSQNQGEADSELPKSKEEPTPGCPRHQLQQDSGSLEPFPGQKAPGPEPSKPLQELTPRSPGSPRDQHEPSKPPAAGEPAREGPAPKKREGSSAQAPASKKPKEEIPVIPKGKPKSGRVWKDRSKKRFSQMVQDKPLRTSWQRKMKDRQERKLAKDFARHLEEEKERRRQEKKKRRAENLRRRLENERKAEIVQVIRNPAKLKRAKKKQLRSIEKRDTLAQLQKQPPQRPATKV
ncbi:coiled-coil domain-containing protein 86 [Bos taurus]|uniref:Coiled-coil domain-containing protein 86 n=1 Tax=Bos taurus TaxID=9913 RepID=CCD86_BOVIN|nr:coiled-coil domain-containing protein 86 [Bos taurus]Q2TBX7.1 RecName: Full=Coiled-coil domain-containing protein 86 [Bos taurus]AAI09493.1 Coiled-coil domain containing 86 [Bos taurus]